MSPIAPYQTPISAADEVLRRCGADSARGTGYEDDLLIRHASAPGFELI